MDPGVASIVVATIATAGTVLVALINAFKDTDRAVRKATGPLKAENARLRELVLSLGGEPDG